MRIQGTTPSQRTPEPALEKSLTPANQVAERVAGPVAGETPRANYATVRQSRQRAMQMERGRMSATQGANGFRYPEGFRRVSAQQLRRIMPNASEANIAKYTEPLNQAMAQHNINTPARQQAFLAQVAHESGQLNYSEEIASGRAYEGRRDLGNTQRGDGQRFKGRGLIQLTGRANYADMSREFGRDLVANPQQVANDPYLSARVAARFFEKNGLNELADQRRFVAITETINGGRNGLRDRQEFYEAAQTVIG